MNSTNTNTNTKIVVVDFAGTLVPLKHIHEANDFRSKILQTALPTDDMHAQNEKLYECNNEAVESVTGITKDMQIVQTDISLDEITLSGENIQTQIATNLFQIGMYVCAKKYGESFFTPHFIKTLQTIRERGYTLAIVSGIRTDIISGILEICGVSDFTYIFGQPTILGVSNEDNYAELSQYGLITHIIGDKLSDIQAAKDIDCQSIFVTWGTPTGGEEDIATYTLTKPQELLDIIR